MSFLALILTFFAAFHLPWIRRLKFLRTVRDKASYAIACGFLFTGVSHFTNPARFVAMMPPFIPAHDAMVAVSGVAELAGAVGLMIPATRRAAGIGLIALLLAIFPANIYVAVAGKTVAGMPDAAWYYWVRLPFQLVYIAWIRWCAVQQPRAS